MNDATEQQSMTEGDGANHYYSEQYLELQKEPVLYEWNIEHRQYGVWSAIGVIGGALWAISLWFFMFDDSRIAWQLSLFFFVLGVFAAFQIRYLFMPDQLYHYRMTAKGIYYSQQDNIPAMAYTIARGIGWLLILVSLIAMGLVGPLALAGAGAGAFLAFKITKMKPRIFHDGCKFKGYGELSLFRTVYGIKIREMPRETGQYGIVLTHPEDYEKVLGDLVKSFHGYQVTEAASRKEFGY